MKDHKCNDDPIQAGQALVAAMQFDESDPPITSGGNCYKTHGKSGAEVLPGD